jgi:hypothetical protein
VELVDQWDRQAPPVEQPVEEFVKEAWAVGENALGLAEYAIGAHPDFLSFLFRRRFSLWIKA